MQSLMLGFREITKSEFFETIGQLNCHPVVRGRYQDDNYGSDFKAPNGRIIGKTIMSGSIPQHKPYSAYYLAEPEGTDDVAGCDPALIVV